MTIWTKRSVILCAIILGLSGAAQAQVGVPSVGAAGGSGAAAGAGVATPQLSTPGDAGVNSPVGEVAVDGLGSESADVSPLPGLTPTGEGEGGGAQAAIDASCGQAALAAVMQPLCTFYQRMLRVVSSSVATGKDFTGFISALHASGQDIHFHRLAVMDLLVMDTQSVEFFLVDGKELKQLGVSPDMVSEMPEVLKLKQQLEKTMTTLPEGIGRLPDTMALAVWGKNEPPVGSIMEQPLAVVLRPSALVLLEKLH